MTNDAGSTTILGSDVALVADVIRFDGDVHVYGSIVGDVHVANQLVIAEGGSVDGDVHAGSAQVGGRLIGDVTCGRFDIKGAGSVVGVIRADRWSMEPGAVVEAEFVHEDRVQTTKEVPGLKAAYLAALNVASNASGTETGPSTQYLEWAERLSPDPGTSRKFADPEAVGRAAWSKSAGSESSNKASAIGKSGVDLFDDSADEKEDVL